jgi:sortase A
LFTNLNKVSKNDTFTVEILDEVLSYKVSSVSVVEPDETEALRPVEGKDLVTLVTCTPLGINSQRILVTGERITPTPTADVAAAGATPDISGFPWWIVGVVVVVLGGGVVMWRSGYHSQQ